MPPAVKEPSQRCFLQLLAFFNAESYLEIPGKSHSDAILKHVRMSVPVQRATEVAHQKAYAAEMVIFFFEQVVANLDE